MILTMVFVRILAMPTFATILTTQCVDPDCDLSENFEYVDPLNGLSQNSDYILTLIMT
jgi:hypothetical protein